MEKIELPDLEELGKLVSRIGQLFELTKTMEVKFKIEEAKINKEAITNPKYFQNGKPPSQSYIDNTWKFCGFENELVPLREKYAELSAELEYSELRYKYLTSMVELWRTKTANERSLGIT